MTRLMMTLDSDSLDEYHARLMVQAFMTKAARWGTTTRATIEQLGGGNEPIDLLNKKE